MIDPLEALYTGQDPESLNIDFRHESTKMLSHAQKKHAQNNKSAKRLNNTPENMNL